MYSRSTETTFKKLNSHFGFNQSILLCLPYDIKFMKKSNSSQERKAKFDYFLKENLAKK